MQGPPWPKDSSFRRTRTLHNQASVVLISLILLCCALDLHLRWTTMELLTTSVAASVATILIVWLVSQLVQALKSRRHFQKLVSHHFAAFATAKQSCIPSCLQH